MRVGEWLAKRKTVASVTVLAVVLAAPVTVAVLHDGFPLDDVDLSARDVWITNESLAHVGRLNMQIRELNGSVFKSGQETDVFQDGDDVFVLDPRASTIERIDPSFAQLREQIELPIAATVAYGGDRLSVVAPDRGAVWVLDGAQPLAFDDEAEPIAELGRDSRSVVTDEGDVLAYATDPGAFLRLDRFGGEPTRLGSADVAGGFELTAVGERAVLFDHDANELVFDDGRRVGGFPETIRRVQQPGPARDAVVVATNSFLLRVAFDGTITVLGAPGENGPATSSLAVAAPVVVGACIYSAWASSEQYFAVCDGAEPVQRDLADIDPDPRL